MRKVLIISPDPETGRMLTLAFELAGWEVEQATGVRDAKANGAKLVVLDMVEGAGGFRKALTASSFKGAKVVALAPRGEKEEDVRERLARANLVVRRPFELVGLVRMADGLVSK